MVIVSKSKTIRITHEMVQESDATVQNDAPRKDTSETEKKAPISTAYDTLTRINTFVHIAESLCTQALYSPAHILLLEAGRLLEELRGKNETIVDLFIKYFDKITTVYTTRLPEEYLDSVSANIGNMIFQNQVSRALDTVSVFEDDSSFLSMLACDQGVPYNVTIEHNQRVHSALYTIMTRRHKTLARFLNSTYYYLPFMQNLFAANGLPTDLCFLPILESGYNPYAYSYAHASGLWQFIPSTGRDYGLRINYWVDERRDLYKATNAAIAYFKKLYTDFNDWHLALAAYNCGEARVGRAMLRAKSDNYWKLKLPRQTIHYVPQFIAYQMIAKNPQCFGFSNNASESFNPDTVFVSEGLDLYVIAEGLGVPYSFLKNLNPHLLHHCTPPDMEDVALYLPSGYAQKFRDFYATLSAKDKVVLFRYRIRGGDNLSSISRRFKISVATIRSLNRLKSSYIVAGRYLYIPLTPSKVSSAQRYINPARIKNSTKGNRNGLVFKTE